MNYQIYQLKSEFTLELGFRSLAQECSEVDIDRYYDRVYEGHLDTLKVTYNNLRDIYRMFNGKHPEGFRGHSLSVSDIVKLDDEYYYCQPIGWKQVENREGADIHGRSL